MAVIEIAKIQVRRGQENVTGVPQLDPGEFGWAEDTQNLYIGKRISEGANNDENTRVLTQKDLDNIFDLLGVGLSGSAASTSTYRYRNELPFPQFGSTTTTIAKKLDAFVQLADFHQGTLSGDITLTLKKAIENLYSNNYFGTDTIRTLQIPAGEYIVSGVVDLPPYATLIGEGAGVTRLILSSAGQNMFRTVDGLGNHYEQGMQFNDKVSRNVTIADMTLAYVKNNNNDYALVSLDNTQNPTIRNVEFKTENISLSTSTSVNTGTGINIRADLGQSESTAVARDTYIFDCSFYGMKNGITTLGLISSPKIENNSFRNLTRGVRFASSTTATPIVTNPILFSNKFTFIKREAVEITTNTNRTNLISENNSFYYIGNNSSLPDNFVTYQAFPVMTFNAPGNASINDHFNRRDAAAISTASFYYNSLINANASIVDKKTRHKTLLPINDQEVVKIPLTGTDQICKVEYNLFNVNMSRKGLLTLNIASDGFASVSDYYNYSEILEDSSQALIFSTDMTTGPADGGTQNYISLTCSSFAGVNSTLEFTIETIV